MELKNIEFYATPEGEIEVKLIGGQSFMLSPSCIEFNRAMLDKIGRDYPRATLDALTEMMKKSSANRIFFEFKMVRQFCRCNFALYNQQSIDIDADGEFRFEGVFCPYRGECRYNNIICNPHRKTILSHREKEVLVLIADGLQASDIADLLSISVSTVNNHRENIKDKLGLKSRDEIISFYYKTFKDGL